MTGGDDDDEPTGPTAAAVLANPDLDPDLAAKLQRWFGSDASGHPPAEGEGDGPDDQQVSADDEGDAGPPLSYSDKLALLLEHADAELLAHIDRDYSLGRDHRANAGKLEKHLRGTFTPLVEPKLRAPNLVVEQVPVDIEDAIKEDNTPQAILRDLHRIEWDFEDDYRLPITIPRGHTAAHRDEHRKAQEAYDTIRHLREVELSHSLGQDALHLIREIINEGYSKPDSDSREESDG